MRPEQVQACYQTRFFGVVGTDDRSEADMTDVWVVRVHLGFGLATRGRPPAAPPPCIPAVLVPLASRRTGKLVSDEVKFDVPCCFRGPVYGKQNLKVVGTVPSRFDAADLVSGVARQLDSYYISCSC